jgi:hypothetical protein
MSSITSGTVVSAFKQTRIYTEDEIKEIQRKKNLEIKNKNNKISKNNRTTEALVYDRSEQ